MQRQEIKHKQHKKHKEHQHKKTIINSMTFKEVFIGLKNVGGGLTKFETISDYYNKEPKSVLVYNKTKIEKLWKEISYIKRYSRKKGVIAVICKWMPRGTELWNSKHGKRQLKEGAYIYFSCTEINDAIYYRGKLDKVARGFFTAGSEVEEITEREMKQKPILKALNKIPQR